MPVLLIKILFWLSVALLAYIYAGYPLLVALLAKFRPNHVKVARWHGTISIVLVAHNEAPRIAAKLSNLFASTISDQIVEVLVGSDGSTDGTADIAAGFPDHRVQVVDFETRRGKAGVINDLASHCRGDVIVFVDARQNFAPTALALIVENFSDPTVGVVSGELVFLQDDQSTTAADGVGFYWNYEKWIRTAESQFRSVPGATGALYALRNELFRPIPEQTLLDDVVIPMQAIEQGYRCVLERGAVAYDRPSPTSSRESIRKRRTIAGCAQLILSQPRWMRPSKNPIWWEFCSHKLARLASPLLLAVAAGTNIRLAAQPFYTLLLTVQGAFYVAALVGWIYQHRGRRSQLFGPFLMFVSLNGTTILALWDALLGRFRPTWQKSAA
jgi:cellulose synthase/poly-beta-1,6-N-acetylglucosamine synthase-like glycosyltransferase